MLLNVLESAKRPTMWRRLTPLWVGLWLMSSFGDPAAAWQHLDGTLCQTCTRVAPAFGDECEPASQSTHHAIMGASAPDDCYECCVPTPQKAPDKLISPVSHAAIMGISVAFAAPVAHETRLFFAPTALPLDALPRPPPRGRAPPLKLSMSPFCLSKAPMEHEKSIQFKIPLRLHAD